MRGMPGRMIHPATRLAFINDALGSGVVATQRIPRGTVVWAQDPLDIVIAEDDLDSLPPEYQPMFERYAYEEHDRSMVLCWDHGRFVNHSCQPNAMAGSLPFVLAVRDIEAGEQITEDYGSLGLSQDLLCSCGAESCRRVVRDKDYEKLQDTWDREVEDALEVAGSVDQPLFHFLDPESQALIQRMAGGPLPAAHRPQA